MKTFFLLVGKKACPATLFFFKDRSWNWQSITLQSFSYCSMNILYSKLIFPIAWVASYYVGCEMDGSCSCVRAPSACARTELSWASEARRSTVGQPAPLTANRTDFYSTVFLFYSKMTVVTVKLNLIGVPICLSFDPVHREDCGEAPFVELDIVSLLCVCPCPLPNCGFSFSGTKWECFWREWNFKSCVSCRATAFAQRRETICAS